MKRLYTQFNKPTNQKSLKVPKVVNPTNKKTLLKSFGTSVINSPLSPLSLFLGIFINIDSNNLVKFQIDEETDLINLEEEVDHIKNDLFVRKDVVNKY